jgi:hypothetical protein
LYITVLLTKHPHTTLNTLKIVRDPQLWATVNDPKMVERIWLRPGLAEIYDIEWSPDSLFLIAGSIDSKVLSQEICLSFLLIRKIITILFG